MVPGFLDPTRECCMYRNFLLKIYFGNIILQLWNEYQMLGKDIYDTIFKRITDGHCPVSNCRWDIALHHHLQLNLDFFCVHRRWIES